MKKNTQYKIHHTAISRENRIIALFVCINMIFSFVLPLSVIVPMKAQAKPNISDIDLGIGEIKEAFDTVATEIGTNWYHLESSQITQISIRKEGDNTIYSSSPIVIDAGGNTSQKLNLTMDYQFSNDQLGSEAFQSTHTLYYQLPSELVINQNYYGSTCQVTDSDYSTSLPSGYYSISKNGLMAIQFTNDYVNYLNGKNGLNGSINFNGYVDRKNDADGDMTFNMGSYSITVQFNDDTVGLTKTGTVKTGFE